MKHLNHIYLALLVALLMGACNTTNEQVLQNETNEVIKSGKKGQQGPPAPLTSEDFHYEDPACVGESHLFTMEGTEGENLQVQMWDEIAGEWIGIFQENQAENATTTFTHTFGSAGSIELRVKIGGGGFTEGFFITVEDCNCEERTETAWADGSSYNEQGNWATYTEYNETEMTVTLFAGQNENAGDVYFSTPDINGDVTITINLASGWDFQDVSENAKIQDYNNAPSGKPAPGKFEYKGDALGSSYSITVPGNNFYGIHVDVKTCD